HFAVAHLPVSRPQLLEFQLLEFLPRLRHPTERQRSDAPKAPRRRGAAGAGRKQHMDVLRSRVGAGGGTARWALPPQHRGSLRSWPGHAVAVAVADIVAAATAASTKLRQPATS